MSDVDKADRRILYELDRNSRMPFASLAKKLRLPPETVRFRVNRLLDEGVVSSNYAIIDSGKLGFSHYKVLLRLQSVTEADIREMIRWLVSNKLVLRLVQFDGVYDIGIVYKTANICELDEFIVELTSRFGQFIAKRSLSANVWSKYLPRTHLIKRARSGGFEYGYAVGSRLYDLDQTNHQILKLLARDSRMSAAAIAEYLKKHKGVKSISSAAVLQRIARLEEDRVISGYSISLDSVRLGEGSYKLLLFLNQLSEENVAEFLDYCYRNPHIIHLVKSLGGWDYELDMEVKGFEQYRAILMDLTTSFPQLIKDYAALRHTRVHKYNFYH